MRPSNRDPPLARCDISNCAVRRPQRGFIFSEHSPVEASHQFRRALSFTFQRLTTTRRAPAYMNLALNRPIPLP